MSRKKKRKIAFWVSEDRITEEQKRKILSIIEEDVEFIEYNFPVSITVDNRCYLFKRMHSTI